MKRRIALIHASRAAVDPVTQYYAEKAPELDLTNLLDDGVMRMLGANDESRSQRRLLSMLDTAREEYEAEAALLTCSAVTRASMEWLRAAAGIPLVKIDEPMARIAVKAGRRVGVVATFEPTTSTTRRLLEEADPKVEVLIECARDALRALLAGDFASHDKLLSAAVHQIAARGVDAIVLAQVSMARLARELALTVPVPLFNSLDTSLSEVRRVLG